jgi:anti-sigma factor RsiW
MTDRTPITEDDLHAWVDGRLDPPAAEKVERALAGDGRLAALANHYRRQNAALAALLEIDDAEPVPPRLLRAARGEGAADAAAETRAAAATAPDAGVQRPAPPPSARSRRFLQAAALLAAVALGAAMGWTARDATTSRDDGQPPAEAAASPAGLPLTRAAAVAHAAFVPEVRHPVEVAATEQAHLVAWLSKRLGTALKAPDLQAQGFALMGGRLLPDAAGGVAAQFMFENAGGQRLTLFVRRDAVGGDTAFRFAEDGRVGTFYWLDRGFGYALSGELPRESMLSVATAVYRQLNQ